MRYDVLICTISHQKNNRVLNSILTFNWLIKRNSQLAVCLVWCPRDSNKSWVLWSRLATTSEKESRKSVTPPKRNKVIFPYLFPGIFPCESGLRLLHAKIARQREKNHWKVWELVNMGVALPQPQKPVRGWLWERADKRGRKIRLASILLI